jgi:hypothetical protein
MSWELLKNSNDWAQYKQAAVGRFKTVVGGLRVDWSAGPLSYPCLVDTFVPVRGVPRLASAYVYAEDAKKLFTPDEPSPTITKVNTVGPEQKQFNDDLLAHVMAIGQILVSKGVASTAEYQTQFLRASADIDQAAAKQLDEALDEIREEGPQEDIGDSDGS